MKKTLSFGRLLDSPLAAFAEAQSALLGTSWDFLATGLRQRPDSSFEAVTRSLRIPRQRRALPSGSPASGEVIEDVLSIEVPLLALQPSSTLAIHQATVDLSAEIVSSMGPSSKTSQGVHPDHMTLHCTPTAGPGRRRQTDRSPSVDIHTKLESREPSEGLKCLMDRLTDAISVSSNPAS